MLTVRLTLVFALMVGLTGLAAAQVAGTTPVPTPGTAPAAMNLRIVSPKNNQRIAVDFVNVRYQLTNPAAAANTLPTFQVQLDGADPVRTSSTDHTFTGLTPGAHTIAVELVDANNTPVAGTRTEVHFVVGSERPTPSPTGAALRDDEVRLHLVNVSMQTASSDTTDRTTPEKPASAGNDTDGLPPTGSALPLLSIIGFGVLVGGIASALKTR